MIERCELDMNISLKSSIPLPHLMPFIKFDEGYGNPSIHSIEFMDIASQTSSARIHQVYERTKTTPIYLNYNLYFKFSPDCIKEFRKPLIEHIDLRIDLNVQWTFDSPSAADVHQPQCVTYNLSR